MQLIEVYGYNKQINKKRKINNSFANVVKGLWI